MTVANTQSAEDVAFEFVATKMALQQLIWLVAGGTTSEPDGFLGWVHRSPVPLPTIPSAVVEGWYEEEFGQRLCDRADEIEVEMIEAVGHWLLGTARDRRDARAGDHDG